jgi:branched-chain amino acid transport system substrate-binding protein
VPIVIGSVGNYSGPAGSSLRPTALTVQTWAQWINQRGGLCGRRVQVAVVDDHSDPAQYRAALQDLVENRGVVAFINAASLTGAAGIEYLERVRVPAVGGGCAVEAEYRSSMYFLVCAPPADQYYGAARNAVLFGPASKKFGLITCREVEVCGAAARRELLERNGVESAGAELVYEAQASITQPDFTAECRGAANAGAASVSLMLDAASVRRFGQSCARQGYEPVFSQISATVINDTKDYPGLGDLLVALPTFSFASASTPAQQEFQDAMSQLYDGKPGPAEGLGWASAKLLELAATKAVQASGDVTPASLIAALQLMRDETVGGLTIPLSFAPGKPGSYPACWFAVRAKDGTWSTLNDGKPVCR